MESSRVRASASILQAGARGVTGLALFAVLGLTQAGCLGEYISMTLGSDGFGLISYQDSGHEYLKVAHCEDTACGTATLTVLDANGSGVGTHTSVAIGTDGLGLISYVASTWNLRVAHCEDVACSRVRVSIVDDPRSRYPDPNDRSHYREPSYTSLAVGRDGLGLISYRDYAGGDLLVAHCEDTACTKATVSTLEQPTPATIGEYSAVAIGADGLGLIAYHDRDHGTLKMAHCEDTACTRATLSTIDDGPHVPSVSGYVGARPGLGIGSDGLGLITYQDEPVGNLRMAHCADVACTRVDSISILDRGGMKGTGGGRTSLAVPPDGLWLVAYHGSTSVDLLDQDLRLARCQDVTCRTAVVSSVDHRPDGDVGKYASLVLGVDGLALISYQDGGPGGFGPASVKVAHCRDSACRSASVSVLDVEQR